MFGVSRPLGVVHYICGNEWILQAKEVFLKKNEKFLIIILQSDISAFDVNRK